MPDATNLVVLAGRLTAPVEIDDHTGRVSARFTIAVPSAGPPRRVDALPVRWWDPTSAFADTDVGTRLLVVGTVHRRFWSTPAGRSSRLDIVASRVDPETPEMDASGVGASLPRPCP